MKSYVFAISSVAILCLSVTAWAGGNDVVELHKVQTGERTLVVAVSDNGVVLIDAKKKQTFRGWKSQAVKGKVFQDRFRMVDADRDGTVDLVLGGKKPALISGDGTPHFGLTRGCQQFHLADFGGDKALDLFCRNGNTLGIYTYDGQKFWEYKLSGAKLSECFFGDYNGDVKADIECSVGRGKFVRISGESGEEGGRDFDDRELSEQDDDNQGYAEEMQNALKGSTTFDLDGDGNPQETLSTAGGKVEILKSGAPMGEVKGKAFSLLVEDLDGDGKPEAYVGGAGKVYIFDHAGKVSELNADPARLKRAPSAEWLGLNANNLKDNSDGALKKALDPHQKKIAACYSGAVRKSPYAKSGRVSFYLTVDKNGKVKKAENLASAVSDKKVASCLGGVYRRVKFPAGQGDDASVTVTVDLVYTDK